MPYTPTKPYIHTIPDELMQYCRFYDPVGNKYYKWDEVNDEWDELSLPTGNNSTTELIVEIDTSADWPNDFMPPSGLMEASTTIGMPTGVKIMVLDQVTKPNPDLDPALTFPIIRGFILFENGYWD